ncbi:MAG: hypothetical protein IH861_12580 [Chloroflexi bacterium]|nr:hypothetical protein [Chloroflexota bacterium]
MWLIDKFRRMRAKGALISEKWDAIDRLRNMKKNSWDNVVLGSCIEGGLATSLFLLQTSPTLWNAWRKGWKDKSLKQGGWEDYALKSKGVLEVYSVAMVIRWFRQFGELWWEEEEDRRISYLATLKIMLTIFDDYSWETIRESTNIGVQFIFDRCKNSKPDEGIYTIEASLLLLKSIVACGAKAELPLQRVAFPIKSPLELVEPGIYLPDGLEVMTIVQSALAYGEVVTLDKTLEVAEKTW